MKCKPMIQRDEIYHCVECDKKFTYIEVYNDWKCPICGDYLNIRISIKEREHSCQRVNPNDLSVGEIVTLENEYIHKILDITKRGNNFKIALKELRAIEFTPDSIITRIEGGWY